jgi:hypothetical protein
MKKRAFIFILLVCIGFGNLAICADGTNPAAGSALTVPAATGQNPSQSSPNAGSKEAPKAAKWKSWLGFGFDHRFRHEDWNDIQDQNSSTNDEKHWNSFRQRLWFSAYLGTPNIELYGRLLNQFTKSTTPYVPLNLDEVIFDNLYLNFKKTFIPGVSVKIGRQDITFGEGFIILDGGSSDGPRSVYFNAVDITYARKKSKLDLIGILNPRQDRFLPVIHDQHKNLNESDEQAIAAYYTDKNHKNTNFELYYFLKKEIHDYRASTNVQFRPDRHVSTAGGRIVQKLGHGLTATGEFAIQKGKQHPDTTIQAWGGYGYLKKQFEAKYSPYVTGGYLALSGDDPSTPNRHEGWDPLFLRWPKWSALYVWSLLPEKGLSYWTNMKMVQAEAGFTPWKPITLKGIVYLNDAFHPYAPGNPKVFGNGTRRGVMPQIVASYNFGKSIFGEVRYEILSPGDFYTGSSKGHFFRFELNYAFKHPIAR